MGNARISKTCSVERGDSGRAWVRVFGRRMVVGLGKGKGVARKGITSGGVCDAWWPAAWPSRAWRAFPTVDSSILQPEQSTVDLMSAAKGEADPTFDTGHEQRRWLQGGNGYRDKFVGPGRDQIGRKKTTQDVANNGWLAMQIRQCSAGGSNVRSCKSP